MGYVDYAEPLNFETKLRKIWDRINLMDKQVRIWESLKVHLKRWDGKKLTKRTETALTKEMGTEVRISFDYGLCYVHVDGERIFIGHSLTLDFEKVVEDQQTVYDNCQETSDLLNQGLDKLKSMVDRYNELLVAQQELVSESKKYKMDFDFDILCLNK